MKPDVHVRLATATDAAVLAEALHAFNTEFDTPTPGPAVLAARLARLLPSSTTFAVLATNDVGVVGFGLVTLRTNVWFDGLVALLDELYVEPSLRNHGIGGALMAAMEAECRGRSVDYIEINVDEGDADTRRFYERIGYSSVDPDSGEAALCYSREL